MRSYIHWSFPSVPTALTCDERLTKIFKTLSPFPYLHTHTHTHTRARANKAAIME